MTERERLIELLNKKYDHFCDQCGVNKDSRYTENLADYLLESGVNVLPCKVGDTVWVIDREYGEETDVSGVIFLAKSKGCIIATAQINNYGINETIWYHINETQDNFGTDLMVYSDDDWFLTKEEAEQALKGGANNG